MRGDLLEHSHDLPGGGSSPEIAYGFAYNGAGQLTARVVNDAGLHWSPPSVGTDSYAANGLNQYTSIDSAAPIHDANGNVTTDHMGRVFAYDAENVLRTAHASAGGAELGQYAYYADGMRRQKIAGGATRLFYYDGDQEIAEYEGATLLRRYVRLPGSIDEPFLMIDMTLDAGCTPASFDDCAVFAHQDRLGSVVATTDAAGAIVDKYTYGAYGELGTQSASGFPFRFTGQKLDPETGLYYYKARYYDPETGRFLQTDPIGYADQMNLYAYVGNDPVNGIDPLGLECRSIEGQANAVCDTEQETIENIQTRVEGDRADGPQGGEYYGTIEETEFEGETAYTYTYNYTEEGSAEIDTTDNTVAGWHDHPRNEGNNAEYFSDSYTIPSAGPPDRYYRYGGDIGWVEKKGKPLYLLTPSGKIKRASCAYRKLNLKDSRG